MAQSPCRAKNPAECKFHGSKSVFHTRVLRDKYKVAHEVYLAAKSSQKQELLWDAYNGLREAEKQYFATEEGSAHLSGLINATSDTQHKTIYLDLQKRSEEYRLSEEASILAAPMSSTAPKNIRLPKPKTMLNSTVNGETLHMLSEGDTQNGKTWGITWNERTGTILYGAAEEYDKMQFLGRADSLEKAQAKAAQWYDRVRV